MRNSNANSERDIKNSHFNMEPILPFWMTGGIAIIATSIFTIVLCLIVLFGFGVYDFLQNLTKDGSYENFVVIVCALITIATFAILLFNKANRKTVPDGHIGYLRVLGKTIDTILLREGTHLNPFPFVEIFHFPAQSLRESFLPIEKIPTLGEGILDPITIEGEFQIINISRFIDFVQTRNKQGSTILAAKAIETARQTKEDPVYAIVWSVLQSEMKAAFDNTLQARPYNGDGGIRDDKEITQKVLTELAMRNALCLIQDDSVTLVEDKTSADLTQESAYGIYFKQMGIALLTDIQIGSITMLEKERVKSELDLAEDRAKVDLAKEKMQEELKRENMRKQSQIIDNTEEIALFRHIYGITPDITKERSGTENIQKINWSTTAKRLGVNTLDLIKEHKNHVSKIAPEVISQIRKDVLIGLGIIKSNENTENINVSGAPNATVVATGGAFVSGVGVNKKK